MPDTMMVHLDGAVLERLAKIMGYMGTATAKPGRRLKRKEKLSLLQPAANGSDKPSSHAAVGEAPL